MFYSTAKVLKFNFGDYILKQGETAEGLYVIRSGRVEILKNSGTGPLLLGVATPGQFLGEMSILLGIDSTASARAASEVEVLMFEKSACEEIFTKTPPVVLALAKGLAHGLDLTSRKLEMNNDTKQPEVATRAIDLDWEG